MKAYIFEVETGKCCGFVTSSDHAGCERVLREAGLPSGQFGLSTTPPPESGYYDINVQLVNRFGEKWEPGSRIPTIH